jgi:hypothetical protein
MPSTIAAWPTKSTFNAISIYMSDYKEAPLCPICPVPRRCSKETSLDPQGHLVYK